MRAKAPPPPPLSFIEFVEDKTINPARLDALLQPAIRANHHTNFGPVSRQLESVLGDLNGANPARAACAVANATLGLQAAVACFENHLNRRLRWAISDFGFFTSFIGPFQDQQMIPCDGTGMLDLAALGARPDDSYDAILATNVFGLHENWQALFDFARQHDKVLLIDNAAGFGALAPRHQGAAGDDPLLWAEVVSFHHTKPWGMGEGGAVFLPAPLLDMLRAAINFGVGGGRQLADTRYCCNAKLSELAAAQILARVQTRDDWIAGFRHQAARLDALGQQVGLKPLVAPLPTRAVPGQVAFLCPECVSYDHLINPAFRMLKYYRPGAGSGAGARRLFEHVINLPCHGGMAALSDKAILSVLRNLPGLR